MLCPSDSADPGSPSLPSSASSAWSGAASLFAGSLHTHFEPLPPSLASSSMSSAVAWMLAAL